MQRKKVYKGHQKENKKKGKIKENIVKNGKKKKHRIEENRERKNEGACK